MEKIENPYDDSELVHTCSLEITYYHSERIKEMTSTHLALAIKANTCGVVSGAPGAVVDC